MSYGSAVDFPSYRPRDRITRNASNGRAHPQYNSVSSYRLQLKSCQSAHSFIRYGLLFFNVSPFLLQDAWWKRTNQTEHTRRSLTVCPFVRTHLRPDCSYAYGISVLWLALTLLGTKVNSIASRVKGLVVCL